MNIIIKPMEIKYANEIANWKYSMPYEIYNLNGSQEDIEELLKGSYYVAIDKKCNIVGYFCFGNAAQVPIGNKYGVYDDNQFIDIGLGMRPDLCGKGKGYEFFIRGLEFGKEIYSKDKFRLTVAEFNKRAINLYEKVGFKKVTGFKRLDGQETIVFLILEMS